MKKYSYFAAILLIGVAVGASAYNTPVDLPKPTTSSDGGPIALCRPGTNCDPNTQLQKIASDGGPIALCRPGTSCEPNTRLRQAAGGGRPQPDIYMIDKPTV